MRKPSDRIPNEPRREARAGLCSRAAPVAVCLCVLGPVAAGFSQEPPRGGGWVLADAQHEVFLLPTTVDAPDVSGNTPPLAAQSYEAGARRFHIVEFEGGTYTAETPLEGPHSWVVFDPARRGFNQLLPSIRLATSDPARLDPVVRALGATDVTVFDSLGFTVVHLPPALHPAEAVARVEALPGAPTPSVRPRGPRIEWR